MPHFTIDNVAYYHSKHYTSLQQLRNPGEMHGARRVITFCLLTAVLPTILLIIPLYLRHSVFADVTYAVAESDVLEAIDGISTVFCQEQTLKMNTSFTAFQLKSMPTLSTHRKHIQLNKSMVLPDDTLEYWGFYLLKGSTIILSACSRFEGSRVLAVIGEKNLRTCGLKEHAKPSALHPLHPHLPGHGQTTQVPHGTQNIIPKDIIMSTQPTKENAPVPTQHVPNAVQKKNTNEEEFEGEDESDEADEDEEKNDSDEDYLKEDTDRNIKSLEQKAESIIIKHLIKNNFSANEQELNQNKSRASSRRVRHAKKRLEDLDHVRNDNKQVSERNDRRKRLQDSLNGNKHVPGKHKVKQRKKRLYKPIETEGQKRQKRDIAVIPGHMLDGGIGHGGNAANMSNVLHEAESSESSFEINLRSCYEGQELFTEIIPPSHLCSNIQVLNQSHTMFKSYEVEFDGYYYYIFYSDNDFYQNTIHAQFNIYKPTYQHTNYSRDCINQTECSFPISFLSDEIVIVEVPTKDGIEHEDADMAFLISSCYPRMSIYIIFPVAVLFLVLGCAFL